MSYDAILIPGGGVTPEGEPTPWVRARLDKAAEHYKVSGKVTIMPLSAGTPYKAPPLDDEGFPIFESIASARYLVETHGVSPEHVIPETSSYSTIGNAAFARWILTDPDPAFRNLLIITSEFHMSRTKRFFEWVFSLPPINSPYTLTFETVENVGIDEEILKARAEKEQGSLDYFELVMQKVKTLQELHAYLLTEYPVYAMTRLRQPRPKMSASGAKSY